MDPLSISASIIALCQGTNAVIDVCWRWRVAVKDAPWNMVLKDLKLLRGTLENLAQLAEEVEDSTGDPRLPIFQRLCNPEDKSGPLVDCRDELERLQKTLKLPDSDGNDVSRMKQVIRALHWTFDEASVKESLGRLQNFTNIFANALQVDSIKILLEVGSGISDMRKFQVSAEQNERRRDIRNWLAPPDPSSNHQAASDKRHELTGNWLLAGSKFRSWKTSPNSLMWLYGIPGAGKSVLSSTIINNLLLESQLPVTTKVACYYFDFSDSAKQEAYNMIRSLLIELGEQSQTPCQPLEELYLLCHEGRKKPSKQAMLSTLLQILKESQETFIVVDAMDECTDRGSLHDIICTIHDIKAQGLHFLLTSRKEVDIENALKHVIDQEWWVDLQNSAVDDDIATYVDATLSSDPQLRRWESNKQLHEEILTTFKEKAGGMFRWATCQLDALKKYDNVSLVRKALKTLPKDLDGTYDRILLGIDEEYTEYIHAVLQWLAYCHHPLTIEQLADVVLVDHGGDRPIFDEDRRISPYRIAALCSGLISLVIVTRDRHVGDTSTETQVRFAHFSVQEYLLSKRIQNRSTKPYAIDRIRADTFIVNTCLAYLLHFDLPDLEPDAIEEEYPLAHYAATFWFEYVKKKSPTTTSDSRTLALTMALFRCEKNEYRNWLRLFHSARGYLNHARSSATSLMSAYTGSEYGVFAPPIVWAAGLGLDDLVDELLAKGVDVNKSGASGISALALANFEGHYTTMEILLKVGGDVSDDFEEGDRPTYESFRLPLYWASKSGNSEYVALLLKDRTKYGRIGWKLEVALEMAAEDGSFDVVQLLIEAGADVNAQGRESGCPLQAAAQRGKSEAVRVLLRAGADPNTKGGLYYCPLQAASYWKHPDIIKILLEAGASIIGCGGAYGTSLIASSWSGSLMIVEQLLKASSPLDVSWDLATYLYEMNFKIVLDPEEREVKERAKPEERRKEKLLDEKMNARESGEAGKGEDWEHRKNIEIGADRIDENMTKRFTAWHRAFNNKKYRESYYGTLRKIRPTAFRILKRLNKAGVQVDSEGRYFFTAVQAAIAMEWHEIVQVLLTNGAVMPEQISRSEEEDLNEMEKIARMLRLRKSFEYTTRNKDGSSEGSGTTDIPRAD